MCLACNWVNCNVCHCCLFHLGRLICPSPPLQGAGLLQYDWKWALSLTPHRLRSTSLPDLFTGTNLTKDREQDGLNDVYYALAWTSVAMRHGNEGEAAIFYGCVLSDQRILGKMLGNGSVGCKWCFVLLWTFWSSSVCSSYVFCRVDGWLSRPQQLKCCQLEIWLMADIMSRSIQWMLKSPAPAFQLADRFIYNKVAALRPPLTVSQCHETHHLPCCHGDCLENETSEKSCFIAGTWQVFSKADL